jgi:hypothetical protein
VARARAGVAFRTDGVFGADADGRAVFASEVLAAMGGFLPLLGA